MIEMRRLNDDGYKKNKEKILTEVRERFNLVFLQFISSEDKVLIFSRAGLGVFIRHLNDDIKQKYEAEIIKIFKDLYNQYEKKLKEKNKKIITYYKDRELSKKTQIIPAGGKDMFSLSYNLEEKKIKTCIVIAADKDNSCYFSYKAKNQPIYQMGECINNCTKNQVPSTSDEGLASLTNYSLINLDREHMKLHEIINPLKAKNIIFEEYQNFINKYENINDENINFKNFRKSKNQIEDIKKLFSALIKKYKKEKTNNFTENCDFNHLEQILEKKIDYINNKEEAIAWEEIQKGHFDWFIFPSLSVQQNLNAHDLDFFLKI